MRRVAPGVLAAVAVTSALILTLRVGQEWGRFQLLNELTYAGNRAGSHFDALTRFQKLSLAMRGALLRPYHGAYLQDRWIAGVVFPGVRNGYYVDVGAGDGTRQSNTRALDDLGWQGIAIDPFPTGFETRHARLFRDVVSERAGDRVHFRKSGFMGGIDATLGFTKGMDTHRAAEVVELVTTTLNEILAKASAPSTIDYMSLDIEGAEYAALQGLDFNRYAIGALTIEHNWEEPKRTQIRELLKRHGFRNVMSLLRDDFYVHHRIVGKWGDEDP